MSRIPRVRTGQPVKAAHINLLAEAIETRTPLSFHNGLITQTPHGFHVKRKRTAPSAGAPPVVAAHPFQVLMRNAGSTEAPVYQAGVVYQSSLFKSLRPNDKQAITGLLSEDQTTGWFDLIGNDAIWLGVIFDSAGNVTFAQIDSWGQGDSFDIDAAAWSGNDGYCEDDGGSPPHHQTSRKLIAYTIAGDDGEPVLTQAMFRDQVLRALAIDGRAVLYLFDHEGGYPIE